MVRHTSVGTLLHTALTLVLAFLYLSCKLQDPSQAALQLECGQEEAVIRAFAARDAAAIEGVLQHHPAANGFVVLLARHCLELLDRDTTFREEMGAEAEVRAATQEAQQEKDEARDDDAESDCPANENDELDSELQQFADVQTPAWLEKRLAKHFDLTQFHAQFFFHAMRMRNRINCAWKTDGSWFPWRGYDKYDINGCDQETPECILWRHPRLNNSLHSADHVYRKCCIEHRRLKKTLQWALDAIHSHNVSAWLAMGSLMGQVRHRGVLIPWDTDIDLYVDGDHEDRLLKAFPNTVPRQHWFGRDPQGRAVYWIYYHPTPKVSESHIELWLWRKGPTKDPTVYNRHVYPLQRCHLYGYAAWCPADSNAMLREWYGDEWAKYQFTRGATTMLLTDAVGDKERYRMVQEYYRKMHKAQLLKKQKQPRT
eukprot:GGOE01020775.1.p1 GENE.GGOE01020775.1~~GGOE01020775.1.p1  ORF type:complete len:427 (+),score=137.90 GGOE01020775.1:113-1393(+)